MKDEKNLQDKKVLENREENFKKSKADDKMLKDEELEQVAGGTYLQTSDDSFFLDELNPDFFRVNVREISSTPGYFYESRIAKEWSKYGVEFKWHDGESDANEYFIDGKKVSREDAYARARKIAWHR